MPVLTVRRLQESDHADWRSLWTAYLEFYETTVPEEVYATTWKRLFSEGEFEPKGFIALIDGKAVGLTHYLDHRSCWAQVNNCYLQDLFAAPEARGKGAGAALIAAVKQDAAKAVTDGGSEATLERLDNELSIGAGQRLLIAHNNAG